MGFLDNIEPQQPAPLAPAGPRVAPSTSYAAAALRDELINVRDAPEGQRNQTLVAAAFSLRSLITAGALDESTVVNDLYGAARAAGLDDREIETTIRSGFAGSDAKVGARTVPEQPARPAAERAQAPAVDPTGSPWGNFPPIDAANWMFDPDNAVVELWGQGDDILWAEGEAIMLCGMPGVGKSTLAGQLLRAQLGLQSTVLDLPVATVDRPILYLAMDRPRQIRRSLRRQFNEDERDRIAGRLFVRPGPPISDMALDPTLLTRMAEAAGAGVVYVDSLKDAVVGLSNDEAGSMYNRARQSLLASGVQICELHHLRKPSAESSGGISSIYGSTWLASGAGSVVILSGEPGDLVVRFRHVKTPASEVGPWQLHLDPDGGSFTVRKCDLLVSVRNAGPEGLTAEAAAVDMYETRRHTSAEQKKAERQLDRLVRSGQLIRTEGRHGPVWFLKEEHGASEQVSMDGWESVSGSARNQPERVGTFF